MSADESSYTNSSLAAARRCLRYYDWRYLRRLELDSDEEREALAVGGCWHEAFDAQARTGTVAGAYSAIEATAPSELWSVKLSRLYAAHAWHWSAQPLTMVETEWEFDVDFRGRRLRGKVDGMIKHEDGRVGVIERKTTSDSVEAESLYWDRLRMDVQVGMYGLAASHKLGRYPDFVIYDVVRKPTISPKNLSAAEVKRMRGELSSSGCATYFGESFRGVDVESALSESRESSALYGARLTADIGDRPGHYFARREVPRLTSDYETLQAQLIDQINLLEYAEDNAMLHRNPDACSLFGKCDFFGLCERNLTPGLVKLPPDGYRVRDRLHAELSELPD